MVTLEEAQAAVGCPLTEYVEPDASQEIYLYHLEQHWNIQYAQQIGAVVCTGPQLFASAAFYGWTVEKVLAGNYSLFAYLNVCGQGVFDKLSRFLYDTEFEDTCDEGHDRGCDYCNCTCCKVKPAACASCGATDAKYMNLESVCSSCEIAVDEAKLAESMKTPCRRCQIESKPGCLHSCNGRRWDREELEAESEEALHG